MQDQEEHSTGLVIGSDHAGWLLEQTVIDHIRKLGHDVHSADQCVGHDDVNVMCIGAQIAGAWLAVDLVSSYLSAEFYTDEDFRRRVEKPRVMDEQG
ncbi:hypothetical protein UNPF46_19455 [Bradyrhizobium sp. UNPF46]|uniref:RpiB/LacA/LacB family sugar-phosphate isomerase n=1 Tax=Bradyrhizobium sp. UNPF46 TaxID=1141168 RepID=UPI0011500840|nr:RpiB/LacA/LacB family sugar-phosphate isomerase [Bradyrhizobium sp. UNPF46]TQF37363.1 hypothetical protein UNPF46_19455 [Bradyrhizobium sp. UNPF46]